MKKSVACPHCGAPMRSLPALLVEPSKRTATRFGITVGLTGQQTVILDLLDRRYPSYVRAEAVVEQIYGQYNEPDQAERVVMVQISYLRRVVAGLGVTIDNVHGVGYRLGFEDAPITRWFNKVA